MTNFVDLSYNGVMEKLPFNVSARAAHLIGRENVSNQEGAVIELVKNSYDADASVCIVFFHAKYKEVPNKLTGEEYLHLCEDPSFANLRNCYEKSGDSYVLKVLIGARYKDLQIYFASLCEILIVDNGNGMNIDTIKNHWMLIGTSNKLDNYISDTKRIQTGAKGIGRFALDRLGNTCTMITLPKNEDTGFVWKVNWGDFENEKGGITSVCAELETVAKLSLNDRLNEVCPEAMQTFGSLLKDFEHGTILHISAVRDIWDTAAKYSIFKSLELLTPAEILSVFKMYLFDSATPSEYGEIKSFTRDDYDYFVHAEFESSEKINIHVVRNEFDLSKVNLDLFKREDMKAAPYTYQDFKRGTFDVTLKLGELLPGLKNSEVASEIGKFDFNFYFLKRSTTEQDKKTFAFKDISTAERSAWLDRFGGIKLFRDKFRVRPYGEISGTSFDWLGLGERASKSPAGFAQRYGEFRIRPHQLVGSINISRIANITFQDKSSREGIQEAPNFKLFKNILIGIIAYVEKDREHIGINMKELYTTQEQSEKDKTSAKEIADALTQQDGKQIGLVLDTPEQLQQKTEVIAKGFKALEKENESLLTELQILRTLASSGLVITTFAHELRQLGSNLDMRADLLKKCLMEVVDKVKLKLVTSEKDPIKRIDRIREDDKKLKDWIDFSIDAVKKDKRSKKKINLKAYLDQYAEYWNHVLSHTQSSIHIKSVPETAEILAFQLDLDSIFNNLIANSVTAFIRKDAPQERNIYITVDVAPRSISINYEDSGPGLDPVITKPDEIFDLWYTTKVDEYGNKTGTGLGLYIIRSIMNDYKGYVSISKIRPTFGIKLTFPVK